MARYIMVEDAKGHEVELTIELGMRSVYANNRSWNRKTGNIPQYFIGSTIEESRETCTPCPLYQARTCNSQYGTPLLAVNSIINAHARGKAYRAEEAIATRQATAKAVRMAPIGDPGSLAKRVYDRLEGLARQAGLAVLSYTHQWRYAHAQHLKGRAMASCDTRQDVLDAVPAGWRAALHIDTGDTQTLGVDVQAHPVGTIDLDGTPVRYSHCPAQRQDLLAKGKHVQCNDCRLCDATRAQSIDLIVFNETGKAMAAAKARQAKGQA